MTKYYKLKTQQSLESNSFPTTPNDSINKGPKSNTSLTRSTKGERTSKNLFKNDAISKSTNVLKLAMENRRLANTQKLKKQVDDSIKSTTAEQDRNKSKLFQSLVSSPISLETSVNHGKRSKGIKKSVTQGPYRKTSSKSLVPQRKTSDKSLVSY